MVKSAARILDLLELMAELPHGITLSETARRLVIPKSSLSALLSTLEMRGYVESGADGFRLAGRFRPRGWIGGETGLLVQIAHPVMAELAARTGETAFLGVMTADWGVRYVAKVVSDQPLRYDVDLATVRPAYCISVGLVLLADQPDGALERYLASHPFRKLTPLTVTDPGDIRQMIANVRRQGYAPMADSSVLGTAGAAAAIRGVHGEAVAGLAVIAPSTRFEPAREAITTAVVAAAARITQGLAAPGGSQAPQSGGSAHGTTRAG